MPIAEIRRQADNQDTPQDRHHHQTIAAISRMTAVSFGATKSTSPTQTDYDQL